MDKRTTITEACLGETDLYRVWNGEDAYLTLYDYFVIARTDSNEVEFHHHKMFRTEEEAEKLLADVRRERTIDLSLWHEVQRLTTEERFAEMAMWEAKHEQIHGV